MEYHKHYLILCFLLSIFLINPVFGAENPADPQAINEFCIREGYSSGEFISTIFSNETSDIYLFGCTKTENNGDIVEAEYEVQYDKIFREPTTEEKAERFGEIFGTEILPILIGLIVISILFRKKSKK